MLSRTLLSLALLLASSAASAAGTALYFKSEPGDYIGGGQEFVITASDATFAASTNYAGGVSVSVTNFTQGNSLFWYLDFAAPNNQPLALGTYQGATRFPFQAPTAPGLSVYGDGRGCNTSTGSFTIRELSVDPVSSKVASFAADFEQHCEGGAPALFGSIRINSDVPLRTLLPARIVVTDPLNSKGCVEATGPEGATVDMDAVAPFPGNYSYTWSTATGQSGQGSSFSIPVQVNQTLAVTLTLLELTTQAQVTSVANVCVSDTTPPVIEILSPVPGENLVGKPKRLVVDIFDLVDRKIETYSVFVGYSGTYTINGSLGRASTTLPPSRSQTGGNDLMAEITVKAKDASGNEGTATVNVVLDRPPDPSEDDAFEGRNDDPNSRRLR